MFVLCVRLLPNGSILITGAPADRHIFPIGTANLPTASFTSTTTRQKDLKKRSSTRPWTKQRVCSRRRNFSVQISASRTTFQLLEGGRLGQRNLARGRPIRWEKDDDKPRTGHMGAGERTKHRADAQGRQSFQIALSNTDPLEGRGADTRSRVGDWSEHSLRVSFLNRKYNLRHAQGFPGVASISGFRRGRKAGELARTPSKIESASPIHSRARFSRIGRGGSWTTPRGIRHMRASIGFDHRRMVGQGPLPSPTPQLPGGEGGRHTSFVPGPPRPHRPQP